MKKLFFLAIVILSSANILAQKSLSIQVLDSLTNEPIAGATLSINQKTFVTSNDGYAFINQKDGLNSTCFVRSFGYVSKEIDLLKSTQTTVKLLQESINQVEPQLSPLTPYLWSYKGVDEMLFLGNCTLFLFI